MKLRLAVSIAFCGAMAAPAPGWAQTALLTKAPWECSLAPDASHSFVLAFAMDVQFFPDGRVAYKQYLATQQAKGVREEEYTVHARWKLVDGRIHYSAVQLNFNKIALNKQPWPEELERAVKQAPTLAAAMSKVRGVKIVDLTDTQLVLENQVGQEICQHSESGA